jgi:hypothetical protein
VLLRNPNLLLLKHLLESWNSLFDMLRESSYRRVGCRSATICQGSEVPRGSLVYGGDDEDDFLYCLPDNKEIHLCREMIDNIGYPKLELGLSAMSKD